VVEEKIKFAGGRKWGNNAVRVCEIRSAKTVLARKEKVKQSAPKAVVTTDKGKEGKNTEALPTEATQLHVPYNWARRTQFLSIHIDRRRRSGG